MRDQLVASAISFRDHLNSYPCRTFHVGMMERVNVFSRNMRHVIIKIGRVLIEFHRHFHSTRVSQKNVITPGNLNS